MQNSASKARARPCCVGASHPTALLSHSSHTAEVHAAAAVCCHAPSSHVGPHEAPTHPRNCAAAMKSVQAPCVPIAGAGRQLRRPAAPPAPRCAASAGARSVHASAAAPSLLRRSLLAAGALLPAAALLPAPAAHAAVFDGGRAAAFSALLAAKLADAPVDYRACMRLLFNDVASGGHNGSVHLRRAARRKPAFAGGPVSSRGLRYCVQLFAAFRHAAARRWHARRTRTWQLRWQRWRRRGTRACVTRSSMPDEMRCAGRRSRLRWMLRGARACLSAGRISSPGQRGCGSACGVPSRSRC
jgi:hypothetical protein